MSRNGRPRNSASSRPPAEGRGEGVASDPPAPSGAACRAPLELSRQQYADWLEFSCSGIAIVRSGLIEWCNRRFAAIFGRGREAFTGMRYQELILPEERGRMVVTRGACVEPHCLRARADDGREIHLRSGIAEISGTDGQILLWSLSDVTRETLDELALAGARIELQSFAEQMVKAQENERRRIASELHDGIGQMLSAIKIAVCAERRQAGPGACDRCGTLTMVLERLQETIDEVRRVAMDLRPAILDDLGLIPTLEWFCRELGKVDPGLHATAALDVDEAGIALPLRVAIFRIVQEAARNAVNHARAREIAIALFREKEGLVLRVTDDGVGFSMEGTEGRALGFGLGSMRERARLSGGTLLIRSRPGAGTTVEARWPGEARKEAAPGERRAAGDE